MLLPASGSSWRGSHCPCLAQLVGVSWNGRDWLPPYSGTGFLVTAPIWGAILLMSLVFRSILAPAVPAIVAFAGPFYVHATYMPGADAQEGIRIVFTPVIHGFPSILLGWLIGFAIDWARDGSGQTPTPAPGLQSA
jgi:hypothetical protein